MASKRNDEGMQADAVQASDADGGSWGGRDQEVEGGEVDEFDADAPRPSRAVPAPNYQAVAKATQHANAITPEEQNQFLILYAETGQWNQSAYRIGRSGRAFRTLCQIEPGFCLLVQEALQDWRERITGEIVRRGFIGVLKPVFGSQGKDVGNGQVGVIREYSDRLLELEAKAVYPEKYREQYAPPQNPAGVDASGEASYGVVQVPAPMVDEAEWERVYGAAAAGRLTRKVTRPVGARAPDKK